MEQTELQRQLVDRVKILTKLTLEQATTVTTALRVESVTSSRLRVEIFSLHELLVRLAEVYDLLRES